MKATFTRIQSILAVYLFLAAFVLGAAAIPALAAALERAEPAAAPMAPAAPDVTTASSTVTNCTWAGAGGLQEALAGGGTVTFACDGTIVVPEIVIAQDTVLDGTTHNVTLSGNNANRVLRVAGGSDLTVRNLTIANGQPQGSGASADNLGGAINAIAGGDLTIENSVFENNKSLRIGGDILAKASGAAILYQYSNGALIIRDSTFRNNQTEASGGALYIVGSPDAKPSVTITGSTFSNNQAGSGLPNSGGAIAVDGSVAITITNSTLSGNSAYQGGGLALLQAFIRQNMTVRLTHVTLADNTATRGAGFYTSKTSSSSQTIDLANTIVGGGCIVDSGVALNSLGYNLSSDSSCGFTTGTDLQNTDPQLAALADNGGPTQTRALQAGSPAINKIPLAGGSCNDSGVTTDQRGYARPEPSGSLCDIGAYEADAQPPADAGLTIVKETIGGGVFTFTSTSLTPSPFTLTAGQTGTFSGTRNIIGSTRYFNCALQTDGNVLCWGLAPTPPAGPFVELVVGYEHACGLRPDGSVDCWGDNDFGQATDQPGPYTQVATGENYTCGLTPAGAAECWGRNDAGQAQPQPGPYVALDGGYEQTCGLTPTGALECWGDSPFTNAGPFTQMSVGGSGGCAVRPNGDLFCWGSSDLQPGARVGPWVEVSVGRETAVGLRANGTLDIWGDSTYLNSPNLTPPAGSFVRLGQSQYRVYCALDANGAADCWGFNYGGHATDRPGPFGSPSQKTFSNLAAGTYDVTEQVPAGWSLSDLSCDGGNPQVNGATVSVTLAQSEQVTCTYEDTPTGTIVITKQTAPADDLGTQQFGFTDNIASPNTFTLVHGQGRVFFDVPTGTYTVTETSAAGGYYLADLTCTETGGQSQANSSGNLATGEATINLEPGETVRCAYTNALADAIIIEKVTVPADPNGNFDFDFTITDGVSPTNFGLKDGDQGVFYPLASGTYTITEGVSLFHDLTAIECVIIDSSGNETPVSGNLTTGSVALTLDPGEIGFCRFTNTEQASLTVVKEAFPPDGTNFQFEVRNTFNDLIDEFGLQDTDDITNPEHLVGGGLLEPGFYAINELVGNVPDWANVNVACELDDFTPKSFAHGSYGQIVVDLQPGEDVTCTFTNVLMGKINITKQATPDDGTEFGFGGDLGSFTLTHGLMAEYIVPFGAYDVDEVPPLGWQLDDVQCIVDTPGGSSTFVDRPAGVLIDLGPGEEVTCTFNNSEIPRGTINVVKDATPADNTPFRFANTIDNVPFTLNDPLTTTQTFIDVLPGLYRVIELQDDATWELTGIDCVESGVQNSQVSVPFRAAEIQVDPGETVTCTFSNQDLTTGTINILKLADPQGDTAFDFTSDIPGSSSFSLVDDGQSAAYIREMLNVPEGSYTVTETAAQGWNLEDVTCYDDNGDSLGDTANARAQIELLGGEEVTCFFSNQKLAGLTVVKHTSGGDGTFDFTSTTLTPNSFSLTTQSGTAQKVFTDLLPGTYDVAESVPAGWDLNSATCTNGSDPSSIDLAAGENVICTFTNQERGSLTVVKHTVGDDGSFDFASQTLTPGSFSLTTQNWTAQKVFTDLLPGTYDVAETVPAGWELVNSKCTDGSNPASIQISAGEAVVCTFTNLKRASLTVVKHTVGGDGAFDFTSTTLTPNAFSLTTTSGTAQQVFSNLAPGVYDVAETVPAGWDLSSAVCTDGSSPDSIDLVAGENVVCTFTNTRLASLTVVKFSNGGDETFDFTSQSLGAFSIKTASGSGKQDFYDLQPGNYDLAETVPAGWKLSSATCSDDSQPSSINLVAGESVTCTFTNSKLDSLTIVKKTVGGDDTFGFTSQTLTPNAFSLTTSGGTAQQTFTDLTAGVYDVTEVSSPAWQLTSATCDNGDSPNSITLGTGEAVTCTFTNQRRGSLTVIKNTVGGEGTFDFTSTSLTPNVFSLTTSGGTARQTFTNLPPGTYDVTETVPAGWELSSATCSDGSSPGSIILGTGEAVTCTFTNTRLAALTVVKHTIGGDGSFDFTSQTLTPGSFSLATQNWTAQQVFTNLQPGTYDVAESVPAGWELVNTACSDGSQPGSISLSPGEAVTCTFTNVKRASLTVVKHAVGGDDTFDFTSTTLSPSAFSLTTTSGTAQKVFSSLSPGVYDVAESVPAGWDLSSAACSDGSSPDSIDLVAGESVICTFTNSQRASLTVVKHTVGGDGVFDFTSQTLTPNAFSLSTTSGTAQNVFSSLVPGVYDVAETVPAGWDLTSAACTDGSSPDSIDLAAGENVICTFTNSKLAKLTIIKQTIGGDGTFDFTSQTLTPGAFSIKTASGSGKETFIDLLPGTYDLAETVPAGWDLSSAACSDGSKPASISLSAGEAVTCTFTNTRRATLTVVKQAVGGDGTFDFTSKTLSPSAFSLTTASGTSQRIFSNLVPGVYDVSETVPTGWELTSAVCSDGSSLDRINLAAGENVTCTFTNTKLATLTVVKQTVGGDGTFTFISSDLGSFSLTTASGTAQQVFSNLVPGTYDVVERVPAGWDLTSATCSDGSDPASINLAAGENVICTFTNTKLAVLTVVKNTVGGDGAFDFTSQTLTPNAFSLTTASGTAQRAFSDLVPGTYDVTETVPAGWELTSAVCSDGSDPDSIDLAAGEAVTCTFTNTRLAQTGTIIIVKNTVGGDGAFDFTSQTLTPGAFNLTTVSGTAQRAFTDLAPGVYDISETVPLGWQLTGISCSDGSDPASIDLVAGETVTCTFTNTRLLRLLLPIILSNN